MFFSVVVVVVFRRDNILFFSLLKNYVCCNLRTKLSLLNAGIYNWFLIFFYALTPLSNSQINFIFYLFLCTNCCLKFSPHLRLRLLRRTQLLPTMLAKNWPEIWKKKICEIKSIFQKKSCILKSKVMPCKAFLEHMIHLMPLLLQ